MIRVVMDTNVTVSGFLWNGNESDIILACISGEVKNCSSLLMVQELERVLGYDKFKLHQSERDRLVLQYLSYTTLIDIKDHIDRVLKDEADNNILDCAVNAGSEFIITGDNGILTLREYRDIKIVKPYTFMKIIQGTTSNKINYSGLVVNK